MEARVGELITKEFQPALLNIKLLQQRVLEPAVKTTVSRQCHVELESPTVAETLKTVISDLTCKDNGVDLFATMMTPEPCEASPPNRSPSLHLKRRSSAPFSCTNVPPSLRCAPRWRGPICSSSRSDSDTRQIRSVDEPLTLIGTRRDGRPIAYFTPELGVTGSTLAWRAARVVPNTGVLFNTEEEIRFMRAKGLRKPWLQPTGASSLFYASVAQHKGKCKPSRELREIRRRIHVEERSRQQRELTDQCRTLPKFCARCALSFSGYLDLLRIGCEVLVSCVEGWDFLAERYPNLITSRRKEPTTVQTVAGVPENRRYLSRKLR